MRGATTNDQHALGYPDISIHAPRAGRDNAAKAGVGSTMLFQSTRPVRGATSHRNLSCTAAQGFNPRAPCGARLSLEHGDGSGGNVSIHAPRAGRDPPIPEMVGELTGFNPRAPCGARRDQVYCKSINQSFQSTRPVRGATVQNRRTKTWQRSFNPRAPCGARRRRRPTRPVRWCFNPRAPCGARRRKDTLNIVSTVSFNPRAPCGARRKTSPELTAVSKFQSTRPVRGATTGQAQPAGPAAVSIHAPRAGRDDYAGPSTTRTSGFNPRAPCGARRWCRAAKFPSRPFQSTRPVRGATEMKVSTQTASAFQSTRPVRGATGQGEGSAAWL